MALTPKGLIKEIDRDFIPNIKTVSDENLITLYLKMCRLSDIYDENSFFRKYAVEIDIRKEPFLEEIYNRGLSHKI